MASWDEALGEFLKPFVALLGHKKRRQMCPLYVAGLIGPGERKSMQPMAERLEPTRYDRFHHFISDGLWDEAPLEAELARAADRLVGRPDAILVIDDTSLPKKGSHSVGVAPQYASMLGKRANCQTLVSVTLARNEVPVALGLRLFLPQSWTDDVERMVTAGVPEPFQAPRSKPEIALQEIDRARAQGVRFGLVLADAGYGLSASFRQGLSTRGLTWAVGIPKHQKVYGADVALIFPVAGRGRPRKNQIPDQLSVSAETVLAEARWRKVSWRRSTKGPLSARFAACRIRIADGPPQPIHDKGQQHMPGEEAWLVGEWRSSGERKCYLSNLPAGASLKKLAAAIKARWVCEQAHQQMKEELGLDHFEGRSWRGLHRHALMIMIAYAFLQHRRLGQAAGEKKPAAGTAQTNPASGPPGRPQGTLLSINTANLPPLPKAYLEATNLILPK
ncbi:IS701 family transposase [Xanthobacter sp. V0B-10]|uniref:IS701 family transposase n=1 Tax=Xanthobacter albus TaxID=3119929 RepID=UPI00372C834E